MISATERRALVEAGENLSKNKWLIGDITNNVGDKSDALYAEIGRLTGLSGRRVYKIAQVSQWFPPEVRDVRWSFGYYERAYDLKEQAYDAIEFLNFYVDEYEKTPSITNFVPMFRQHILGEQTTNPVLPETTYAPDEPDEIEIIIGRLRYLSESHPRHQDILRLLDVLEDLLHSPDAQSVRSDNRTYELTST